MYFKKAVSIFILVTLVISCFSSCALIKRTVTFDPQNGTGEFYAQVSHGDKVKSPETPVREGYTFDGWYDGRNLWKFSSNKVTEDLKLVARWTRDDFANFSLYYDLDLSKFVTVADYKNVSIDFDDIEEQLIIQKNDFKEFFLEDYGFQFNFTEQMFSQYSELLCSYYSCEGCESLSEFENKLIINIELNYVWLKVVEESTVISYPSEAINYYTNEMFEYFETLASQNNMDLNTYIYLIRGYTDVSQFSDEVYEYATNVVKEEMILFYIVENENIKLSKDEYNSGVARLAEESFMTVDEYVESTGIKTVQRTLIWEKAQAFILDHATEIH